MARRRRASTPAFQQGGLDVGGLWRTYSLAPAAQPEAPLLVVLHGLGMKGADMNRFTGLAERGPAAGFATVFPDGWGQVWNADHRLSRRQGIDDVGFIAALVDRLVSEGVARAEALVLVGISNGAFFAEHLARCALLGVKGLVLVAGTTTEASREASPRPLHPTEVLCFEGTADTSVPYGGGPIGASGLLGRMAARRAGRRKGESRPQAVAVEVVAKDWAEVNGCSLTPSVDVLPSQSGQPLVTKLTWWGSNCPSVVLYRIEGGGHTWPGGPQFLPARFVGPVARQLDATGILIAMSQSATGPLGRDAPDGGGEPH